MRSHGITCLIVTVVSVFKDRFQEDKNDQMHNSFQHNLHNEYCVVLPNDPRKKDHTKSYLMGYCCYEVAWNQKAIILYNLFVFDRTGWFRYM